MQIQIAEAPLKFDLRSRGALLEPAFRAGSKSYTAFFILFLQSFKELSFGISEEK